jgi:uncharacterized membrane protein YphA (DoxX/SURF4 family)
MMDWLGRADPAWLRAVLLWPWAWPLARAILTSAYWIAGMDKALHWDKALAESRSFNLKPVVPVTLATIAVELGGSLLVISGCWLWLGAGALGVFTCAAMIMAYPFWTKSGPDRTAMFVSFCEHLGLIAGLFLAAMVAALEPARTALRSMSAASGLKRQLA